MPTKYPPEHVSPPSSGEEEEEEEDEEEEDEEIEEWTELTPLSELAELEDGPSSHFVGGFSVCQHLGDAIAHVQFKEDIVLAFPGVYPAALSSAPSSSPLELNEARLGGLCVCSVSYASEHTPRSGSRQAAEPRYATPSKRRVGPWFTYLTAAATAVFLLKGDDAEPAKTSTAYNPLQAAASKAATAVGNKAANMEATMKTTSGTSVFAPAITATTANPQFYPVFDFPISIVYNNETADDTATSTGGLPHYVQQEESDEEGEEGEESSEAGGDDADGADQEHEKTDARASREEVAITLAGLCARGGVTLGSITRTHITKCVIGSPEQYPSSSAAGGAPLRIAITAAPLTEALVDYCLVYGGTAYGLYAYPRCTLTMRSCIVEGPNAEAAAYHAVGSPAMDTPSAVGVNGGSVITQLQQRQARTRWLTRYMQRLEDQDEDASDGGPGGASLNIEDDLLPRFCVPGTKTPAAAAALPMSCEVAIMCDDTDVQLIDCLITHARYGVLLHDGCAGTVVRGLSVRSAAEVGFYLYGMTGAANVQYSEVRACGQVSLLVVGPSSAEVIAAEAKLPPRPSEESDEDDDESSSSRGRRRPIFEQHPHIKANVFIGTVCVQGEVRSGAMVDNLVFLPRDEECGAAAAGATAKNLLAVTADAGRGFAYVGVEGQKAPARAIEGAAAA
ncbi:hypothetical protein JKF63_04145 [Porcisia hertigi]|uniref:Uncharacterized protein n=1 Tax=Porcisia hertigi TaxID=2761500 RepID=A0A836LB48_9TRYP|nr:hypothetical protein JKF63_04145 [Porcisia hertigi]